MANQQVDILIVGGGLIGATLLLALAGLGYRTLLINNKPFPERMNADFDARSLALSPASMRILKMLNVWPLLQRDVTAIEKIHVSKQHCFGSTRLQSDLNQPLGYVVEMHYISRALHALLDPQCMMVPAKLTSFNLDSGLATITHATGELNIQTQLLVAADGADSSVRHFCGLRTQVKEYDQHAIVANIGLARAHQQVAYERFTTHGPLALLPIDGLRASLVWALPPAEAARLIGTDEHDFLNALQCGFGYRLGRFVKVGHRVAYPLRQVIMPQRVVGTVVFVGNAAHTLHPVAGQGFNLGLRDIAMLAQCIAWKGLGTDMLQEYQDLRRHDQVAIARFTDGLVELFTSQLPGVTLARGVGLVAVDNIPLLKKLLSRYARGFAGIIPDLVCGIPLAKAKEICV